MKSNVPLLGVIVTLGTVVTIVIGFFLLPYTRDLELGMKGEDVRALQQYLNVHNFPVASEGPGSGGMETTYFGPATQTALARFQIANSITPGVGYFGPKTRAAIAP
jgi:peptidoglycan hydrolase-like protein with peptidoglycan-binding domain